MILDISVITVEVGDAVVHPGVAEGGVTHELQVFGGKLPGIMVLDEEEMSCTTPGSSKTILTELSYC